MTEDKKKAGFDSERMRYQLDKLWKNAMDGLEDLREVVVRASQSARVRLDATFLRRELDRLYQQLGEEAYELVEKGKLDVPAALRDTLDRIHALVEQLAEAEREAEAAEAAEPQRTGTNGAARHAEAGDDEDAPRRATKKKTTRKKAAKRTVKKDPDDA